MHGWFSKCVICIYLFIYTIGYVSGLYVVCSLVTEHKDNCWHFHKYCNTYKSRSNNEIVLDLRLSVCINLIMLLVPLAGHFILKVSVNMHAKRNGMSFWRNSATGTHFQCIHYCVRCVFSYLLPSFTVLPVLGRCWLNRMKWAAPSHSVSFPYGWRSVTSSSSRRDTIKLVTSDCLKPTYSLTETQVQSEYIRLRNNEAAILQQP